MLDVIFFSPLTVEITFYQETNDSAFSPKPHWSTWHLYLIWVFWILSLKKMHVCTTGSLYLALWWTGDHPGSPPQHPSPPHIYMYAFSRRFNPRERLTINLQRETSWKETTTVVRKVGFSDVKTRCRKGQDRVRTGGFARDTSLKWIQQ